MNFQTMDYFVALSECSNVTSAAQKLNITQQTLSKAIASAEHELGCQLFVRSQPIKLTYAGEQFLAYCRRIGAERLAMRQEFADISGDERGRLRVGVTATRGHLIMPAAIAHFQNEFPNIIVELVEGENDSLLELLNESAIDVMVGTIFEEPRL